MKGGEPVFLVGSERSGTTLLRLMLDQHPDIAFNLESEFLVTRIGDNGEFPDVREYRVFLEHDRVFRHSEFRIDESLDFASLLNDFLEQKRSRDGKKKVGATIHFDFEKIRRVWPNARYIYLYRDGRDVARSVVGMGWAGNVYVAADWWISAEEEWSRLRSHLSSEDWIEVRYEELIGQTEKELRRICEFIGVPYSERMFDYVENSSYGLPDTSLNYQWKARMRRRDIQRLEARIGDRLRARGYELSSFPPVRPGAFERAALRLHSRLGVFAHRVRKYGFSLFARELIARRAGLESWQKRLRLAMDRIDDEHLR